MKNTVRLTLDRQEISSAISRNISIYIAESNHALLRPELLLPCGPRGMCQPSFACVSPACSVLFLSGRRVWSLPLYGSSIFLWVVPFRKPSTVCLVGERHQLGRSGPIPAVVWIEEQRVGLAPKGNIPSRCGFTPSSENWRTEPTRSRPCLFRPFRQHPPPPAAPPATSSRAARRAQQGAAELGPQRGAPART